MLEIFLERTLEVNLIPTMEMMQVAMEIGMAKVYFKISPLGVSYMQKKLTFWHFPLQNGYFFIEHDRLYVEYCPSPALKTLHEH